MRILVTGTAGFIGSTLSIRLLERGDEVIGVDNVNDYYDPALKEARLERLKKYENFTEVRISLEDKTAIDETFEKYQQFPEYQKIKTWSLNFSLQSQPISHHALTNRQYLP